ncbi:MAG TPA: hypothetical protein VHD32_03995 [Candidatus Didemnitutus sp.]|nr:hypothetical protein [Candidatus Didemnitutus sp.]
MFVELIIQLIKALMKAGDSAGTPAVPARRREYVEAEQEMRNRQIREEIRRKIEERRAAGAPARTASTRPPLRVDERSSEATTPPPVIRLPSVSQRRAVPVEPPPVPEQVDVSSEVERQAALLEDLRATIAKKEAAEKREAVSVMEASRNAALQTAVPSPLLLELRDPDSFRRAIILREILGPPLALR